MLRLDCVKIGVKVWVLSKIRKTCQKLYFWKTSYVWQITAADRTDDSGEMVIVFAGEDGECLLRTGTFSLERRI